jgi:hypothetical protein
LRKEFEELLMGANANTSLGVWPNQGGDGMLSKKNGGDGPQEASVWATIGTLDVFFCEITLDGVYYGVV